jgi:hypothetical protein
MVFQEFKLKSAQYMPICLFIYINIEVINWGEKNFIYIKQTIF